MKSSLLVLFVLLAVPAFAAGRETETKKIETLISAVAKLDGAKFVRNGKAYDPATAAKFLRGKWERQAKEIVTAGDFIDKIATRSSTTGRIWCATPTAARCRWRSFSGA
jgi:hypothetical protein